jgi:AAA domain
LKEQLITAEGLKGLSVRKPSELAARAAELGGAEYIIEGLIPKQSLSLVVGHSGLGKSPLMYQAAICVAAGQPFLGRTVRQGRVLYMDSENGIAQVDGLITGLASFVGLPDAPDDLLLWNLNDAPGFGRQGNELNDLIRTVNPAWVIIDPINSIFNEIEKDSTLATQHFQELRRLMADHRCSFTAMHHLRKASSSPKERPESLETADLGSWFSQARGSGVLVNGSDVRIGVDKGEKNPEGSLVLRGFERVNGEIPVIRVNRVYGDDGKPRGYESAGGADLLPNSSHRAAFEKLPLEFQFKDAQEIYGKGPSATDHFLKACIAAGIVAKVATGGYRKRANQEYEFQEAA